MSVKPRACILKVDGTNCDEETKFAWETARGLGDIVLMNELRQKDKKFKDYQQIIIPGGFGYGDNIRSGKIEAVELITFLRDQLEEFVASGKPVLGICNGLQVLARTGVLPFNTLGEMTITLSDNDCGVFRCRTVEAIVEGHSVYTVGMEGMTIKIPMAHAEGKLFAPAKILQTIEDQGLVVMRYSINGQPTQYYPENPNGSLNAIAAISNAAGNVMGMMPHPERDIDRFQYVNWRREPEREPQGLLIFQNAVRYAAQF